MRIAKGQFEKGQEVVEGSGDTNWICCGFPEPLRWWDFLTAVLLPQVAACAWPFGTLACPAAEAPTRTVGRDPHTELPAR